MRRLQRACHLVLLAMLLLITAPAQVAPRAAPSAGRFIVALAAPLSSLGGVETAGAAGATLERRLASADGRVVASFDDLPFAVVEVGPAGHALLHSAPEVLGLGPDRLLEPQLAASGPLVGAPAAWASGYTGAGQTVAVLDTGVDGAHPMLAGAIVGEACFSTTSANPETGSRSVCPGGGDTAVGPGAGAPCVIRGCGHGTHVASIAVGRPDGQGRSGLAPGAGLIAVQVFSQMQSAGACGGNPPCALAYTSDLIVALDYLLTMSPELGLAAVNLSLGGGRFTSPESCLADPGSAAVASLVDRLAARGVATVISAGNSGYSDALASPGCVPGAVTVGATNVGPPYGAVDTIASVSNSASWLDLLAPGNAITAAAAGGGVEVRQGTSMAAAHVTGAWALLRQARPGAGVSAVDEASATSGLPVTDPRNGLTRARLQVDAAIAALLAQPEPSPTPEPSRSPQPSAEPSPKPDPSPEPDATPTVEAPRYRLFLIDVRAGLVSTEP